MSEGTARSKKIITEKIRRDLGALRAYWPKEFIPLSLALEKEEVLIPLANGDLHEVDREHILRVSNVIPEYLWDLIKIPFTFRYEKDEDGRSWYVIVGDRWQRRAVELILYGRLTSDGLERINVDEFKRFVSELSSLVFVSISTSLS
jgi:uncharacterized protein (UPF0216 family)